MSATRSSGICASARSATAIWSAAVLAPALPGRSSAASASPDSPRYVEQRLRLKVNREKSVVGRATSRPLLGFGFMWRRGEVKVTAALKAQRRAKERLCKLTSRRWGVSMERRIREINRFTVGWTAYYSYADTPWPFEKLDKWLRRRLRQIRWKEWKRVRTKRRRLIALGIPEGDAHKWACSRKGYWRISSSPILQRALPTAYWTDQGLRGVCRVLPPLPGCRANRPVRIRTPGGVGGAGVGPAPTRSPTFLQANRILQEQPLAGQL
jgi:Group II intron, maturase-specific domain